MNLSDLYHRLPLVDASFCVGQARRHELRRAIVSHPQEHSWGKQDFCLTVLGIECLSRLKFDRTDLFGVQRLVADVGLSLNVVQSSGQRCIRGPGGHAQHCCQDRPTEGFLP